VVDGLFGMEFSFGGDLRAAGLLLALEELFGIEDDCDFIMA
jgi:hypothetical protein